MPHDNMVCTTKIVPSHTSVRPLSQNNLHFSCNNDWFYQSYCYHAMDDWSIFLFPRLDRRPRRTHHYVSDTSGFLFLSYRKGNSQISVEQCTKINDRVVQVSPNVIRYICRSENYLLDLELVIQLFIFLVGHILPPPVNETNIGKSIKILTWYEDFCAPEVYGAIFVVQTVLFVFMVVVYGVYIVKHGVFWTKN